MSSSTVSGAGTGLPFDLGLAAVLGRAAAREENWPVPGLVWVTFCLICSDSTSTRIQFFSRFCASLSNSVWKYLHQHVSHSGGLLGFRALKKVLADGGSFLLYASLNAA